MNVHIPPPPPHPPTRNPNYKRKDQEGVNIDVITPTHPPTPVNVASRSCVNWRERAVA